MEEVGWDGELSTKEGCFVEVNLSGKNFLIIIRGGIIFGKKYF